MCQNDIIHGYESFEKITSLNHVTFKHVQAREDNLGG